MDVYSIYQNGIEKTGPCHTCNHAIDTDIRKQAINMMKESKSINFISRELGIAYTTLIAWKLIEFDERY